jgi:hypothetical protein
MQAVVVVARDNMMGLMLAALLVALVAVEAAQVMGLLEAMVQQILEAVEAALTTDRQVQAVLALLSYLYQLQVILVFIPMPLLLLQDLTLF